MKTSLSTTILILVIHFSAIHACADMYKWTDQNGVTHFSDVPPASEKNIETIETPDYPSPSPSTAPSKPQADTKLVPDKIPTEKANTNKSRSKKAHSATRNK